LMSRARSSHGLTRRLPPWNPFCRDLDQVRKLHLLSKTYGRRPSEIVGVTDAWAAYQFDCAVMLVGLHTEAEGIKESRKSNSDIKPRKGMKYRKFTGSLPGFTVKKPATGESSEATPT
jgi:hypothetical protein